MLHEDSDVMKIRDFVTRCLESVGAIVEFPEYNYAEVLIPDEFAKYFDYKNYFNLSFDFDVARQHEESEFVTYGSYFLDKVIDLATQRGLSCKRHITDQKVELRTLPEKIKGRIAFRNCRSTFLANVPVIHHYILFNFKVSYISDEREDTIVKALVNLNTGHADDRMLKAIGSAIFTDESHTKYTIEQMRSIEDAYQAAKVYLEDHIQTTIHEIKSKIQSRLTNDKSRIMEYYDNIDNELNAKREKLLKSERQDGIESIDDKLRLSQIERQRRLNEIDEKNALRVSILLFNATLISHTKIRNRYSVNRGKAERDVYVVWNPHLNDVEPVVCEVCGNLSLEIELCSNSHLGCTKCVHSCSVCGARLCKSCGMSQCVVCGDPLCGKCKTVCENCGDVVCGKHQESCTCKVEKRRKEREDEDRRRQEKILALQNIPLQFSRSLKQYHDKYVTENLDILDDSWGESILDAHNAMMKGEKAIARPVLQRLDDEYPGNAWVKLSLVLSYDRWMQKLESLAREAAQIAPRLASVQMALGYVNQKHGETWMAIEEYEKVIEMAGDDETSLVANAHFQIGMIHYNRGNRRDARNRLEIALMINPNFESARQAIERLQTRQRRGTRGGSK